MTAHTHARTGSLPAVEENVEAIKAWDRALLLKRSKVQRFSDWVTSVAAGGASMLAHAIWFIVWIVINKQLIPSVRPFDPSLQMLTMIVSLEAIFLALFVLASQNRLSKQADLRANLDLQIDLLAEREMTAVLQLLKDIAGHLNCRTSVTSDQLAELIKKTDIKRLTREFDE